MDTIIAGVGGLAVVYFTYSAIYNLFFHPLASQPGPFLCRISGIPSFYYACRGDRHIWTWRQFQIYGNQFRAAPDLLLYRTPEAYNSIFASNANVKRSGFYEVWRRHAKDINTLAVTDPSIHARRRKALGLAFTDQSMKATIPFMARHIDRWAELLPGDKVDGKGWSDAQDISKWTEYLMIDIFGDVCFGRRNDTKEPGENPLKQIPHNIAKYLRVYNPLAKSPMRGVLLWLKPRGLDSLMYQVMPKPIREYYKFTDDLARSRIETERGLEAGKVSSARQDMFHFMCTARDPDTGEFALSTDDLIADAHMLIVAGSHTTSAAVTGLFFYIVRYPRVYNKLVKEIREQFASAEEIGTSPDFMAKCEYLRAVIQEAMRTSPPGPSEAERTVLKGGAMIASEHLPEGITVGVPKWSLAMSEDLFGDATTFRPERWIPSDHPDTFNSQEDVNKLRRMYHPFSKGPGACIGQKLAMMQMCIIVGRLLWRYDLKNAEGQHVGEGHPSLGWGRSNRMQYQFKDAYIGLHEGPMVQLRRRTTCWP